MKWQCSTTPGVPKSFARLPKAKTSTSYSNSRGASDHLAGRLQRRQADAPGCAVDGIELSGDVFEMMRARVRHILHLLLVDVPGAGGEGVQHRLPDVDPTAVDQADPGQTAAAQQMA